MTQYPSVGLKIGQITDIARKSISFRSSVKLENGFRIRIRTENDDQQLYVKMENFRFDGNVYQVQADLFGKIAKGDDVLLVRIKTQSFSSRLGNEHALPELKKLTVSKQELIQNLQIKSVSQTKQSLFVRIGAPEWIAKLRFEDYDGVILSFKRSDWTRFDLSMPILKQNTQKVRIEFPKFIAENQLDFYRDLAEKLVSEGFSHFILSHLSQKMLIPAEAKISTNENVYVLNDATAKMLNDEKVDEFVYPFENDLENLLSMRNKQGIVPLYYYPELFYSRMPVKIEQQTNLFADETNKKFRRVIKDGITIVYPTIPVALFHYRQLLEKNGFSRFLIDYTGEIINSNVVKRVLKKYQNSESVNPSSNFNFKLGLK